MKVCTEAKHHQFKHDEEVTWRLLISYMSLRRCWQTAGADTKVVNIYG